VTNPATGEVVGNVPIASKQEVAEACRRAATVFQAGEWSRVDPLERARVMNAIADRVAEVIDDLATLDASMTGRPIREMRAQMARLPEWWRHFAGIARGLEGRVVPFKGAFLNYTQYAPLGVVGLITPWNHPLLILVKKLAPALAAGNSVIAKPSELAPLSAIRLAGIACEAGLPADVFQVVVGGAAVGAALVDNRDIAKIDFTGGTATGRRIAEAAARRIVPVTLELGGKAPVLVFDDVPLDEAIAGTLFAAFIASGQTCIAGSRFIVQRRHYSAFVSRFAERAAALKLGAPLDATTEMGPVISANAKTVLLAAVEHARTEGARLVTGGTSPTLPAPLDQGHFVSPTVFADVGPQMALWRQELFGPVVSVTPFDDEEEAISLANDSAFGLGASVWTRDVARAHRVAGRICAGIVWINDHHKNDPASPWGGFGSSGFGKENGWDALLGNLRLQSVVVGTGAGFQDWYGSDASARRYG
jgi:acyl-CoA reductase-like NAD-dependent aldehyde dehydrogenase